jgi:hypothetical protein
MATEPKAKMPEPAGVIVVGTQALRAFTAEQMRAYGEARAAEARREALEEAASVAENYELDIARAIRALAAKEK